MGFDLDPVLNFSSPSVSSKLISLSLAFFSCKMGIQDYCENYSTL